MVGLRLTVVSWFRTLSRGYLEPPPSFSYGINIKSHCRDKDTLYGDEDSIYADYYTL